MKMTKNKELIEKIIRDIKSRQSLLKNGKKYTQESLISFDENKIRRLNYINKALSSANKQIEELKKDIRRIKRTYVNHKGFNIRLNNENDKLKGNIVLINNIVEKSNKELQGLRSKIYSQRDIENIRNDNRKLLKIYGEDIGVIKNKPTRSND